MVAWVSIVILAGFSAAVETACSRQNASSCLSSNENCLFCLEGPGVCRKLDQRPGRCYDGCSFEQETMNATCQIMRPKTNATYNMATSRRFTYLAGATYCDSDLVEAWECKPCKEVSGIKNIKLMFCDLKFTSGYISWSEEDNATLLAFRGTSNIEDWVINLDMGLTAPYNDTPDIMIHDGFYNAYTCFKPQILDYLDKQDLYDAPMVITGHSLGGALAAIAAFDLVRTMRMEVRAVYTYGEPRDGNQAFSVEYGKAIPVHWRHTHHRDIVPHIPLQFQGFYHLATEVWYYEEDYEPGKYTICDGSGEDPKCSNQLFDYSIPDHLNYLGIPLGHHGCY
mmetsp:Transcript_14451/g.22935  ORF Transcript_14451/g.22935 Transcript_14451/m.22935 type:complete len:338 (-) Transcript_14451:334-1347(-)